MIGKEEKEAILKLMPFLNERPVVFDVGSNKGHFADVFLEAYGDNCELHLFEPNEKYLSFTSVKYEYRNNVKYNNVGCHNFYTTTNKTKFYYFENYNNELSSILYSEDWKGLPVKTKEISVTTIDEYSKGTPAIDFLKIDTEGTDYLVLWGAEKCMGQDKVGVIQIEYSEHWQRDNHTFQELKSIADKYGYKIYRYILGNFYEMDFTSPPYDNYYLTKQNIQNHSVGWNKEFIINTYELKFDLVLEVGCFEGLTTKYICEKLLNEGGRVVCVDPLEDYYTPEDTEHKEMFHQQYQRFLGNTRGLPVNLIKKTSDIALPELHELRFDLIYIDGDHNTEPVYRDCVNAFKILKVGGYMLIDDYEWRETTKSGIDRFLLDHQGFYEMITQGYQVMIKKHTDKNG